MSPPDGCKVYWLDLIAGLNVCRVRWTWQQKHTVVVSKTVAASEMHLQPPDSKSIERGRQAAPGWTAGRSGRKWCWDECRWIYPSVMCLGGSTCQKLAAGELSPNFALDENWLLAFCCYPHAHTHTDKRACVHIHICMHTLTTLGLRE